MENIGPPLLPAPLVNLAALPTQDHSWTGPVSGVADYKRRGLSMGSCGECKRRKIKCDKQMPCTSCRRSGHDCVFPPPGRIRRNRKSKVGPTDKEAALQKRLARLEAVVEELSGLVESDTGNTGSAPSVPDDVIEMSDATDDPKPNYPSPTSDDDEIVPKLGRLVVTKGKRHYLSSAFWTSLTAEVDNVRDQIEDSEEESDPDVTDTSPNQFNSMPNSETDPHSFLYGYSSSDVDLLKLHPLPSQLMFYWEKFTENVIPLCNILHVPTMTKTMELYKSDMKSVSTGMEALMFAIYLGTITSLTEEQVETFFGVERQPLLKKYKFGVEQALARAGFIETSDIPTFQAFVIYMFFVGNEEEHICRTWTMTGVVLRLAQAMGLHRDGAALGLPPFETELRRRLWWQVSALDLRASDLFGAAPSFGVKFFDTKLPLNINDADLDPEATSPPKAREGITEMSLCLIRYEMEYVERSLTAAEPSGNIAENIASIPKREALVKDLSERMERIYLPHFDKAGPFFSLAAAMTRLMVANMNLIVYGVHRGGDVHMVDSLHQDVKDQLFVSCIQDLEHTQIANVDDSVKKYRWAIGRYVQWRVMAYILRELYIREMTELTERGWRAVMTVFKKWGDAVRLNRNSTMWIPMRKLMAKARQKRRASKLPLQVGDVGSPYSSQRIGDWTGPAEQFEGVNTKARSPAPIQWEGSSLQLGEGQPEIDAGEFAWLVDEAGMMDIADIDMTWEGWEAVMKDFQMENAH